MLLFSITLQRIVSACGHHRTSLIHDNTVNVLMIISYIASIIEVKSHSYITGPLWRGLAM